MFSWLPRSVRMTLAVWSWKVSQVRSGQRGTNMVLCSAFNRLQWQGSGVGGGGRGSSNSLTPGSHISLFVAPICLSFARKILSIVARFVLFFLAPWDSCFPPSLFQYPVDFPSPLLPASRHYAPIPENFFPVISNALSINTWNAQRRRKCLLTSISRLLALLSTVSSFTIRAFEIAKI